MNAPNKTKLNEVSSKALENLIEIIAKEHKLKNGQTALYWHLASIISEHIDEIKERE